MAVLSKSKILGKRFEMAVGRNSNRRYFLQRVFGHATLAGVFKRATVGCSLGQGFDPEPDDNDLPLVDIVHLEGGLFLFD